MKLFLSIILILFSVTQAQACESDSYESSQQRGHLIELYTSEGCSSCPPAEKWMNSLKGHKRIGVDVFPMAFHVDYWDYIGWKDPYAKKKYSDRQRSYARSWGTQRIYTPGFVLDGEEWRSFFARQLPRKDTPSVGKLKVKKVAKDKYQIEFVGSKKIDQINYAILGSGFKSKVTRGENAGRTLTQNFVVLKHKRENFRNGMVVNLEIPRKGKDQMAVFWGEDSRMKLVQVAGGCI